MIPRRTATAFALAFGLTAFTAGAARAQSGTITVAAGDVGSANIAPNAHFVVPLIVDMSGATGLNLASLVTHVTWTAGRFILDSIKPTAFVSANGGSIQSTRGSGTASIAILNATGVSATTTIANLYFTAGAGTAGTRIQLSPTLAGNEIGVNITSHVRARSLDVCVAPQAPWGDANGDGTVNIIDAQQIARFIVGLTLADSGAIALGDVDSTNTVTITDAQQIASAMVGLSSPVRLGKVTSSVPAISKVVMQPASLDVGIGQTVQLLAVPQDDNGTPLIGCTPLTWNSSDGSAATVDANGFLAAVARGSSTITATAVGGTPGTLALTVSDPIATLSMSRDTATVGIGGTLALSATAKDAGGVVLPSTPAFSSSDPSIATVSSSGQVTAVNVGPVTITASVQDKRASATIQVAPLAQNSLASGDDFSCVLSVAGAAYCWGSDSTYQLGDGSTNNRNTPVAVGVPSGLRFTQIIAANKGACALGNDRSVYCWGARFPSTEPVFQIPSPVSAALQVKAMAGWGSGFDSGLCMIDIANTTSCIGDGTRGQMGTGSTQNNFVLAPVSGGNAFTAITAGHDVVCGLVVTSAYCWGTDTYGALGAGGTAGPTIVSEPAPVVGGMAFATIAAGRTVTCGVTTGDAGFCWGTGFYGSDGDGDVNATSHTSPNAIATTLNGGVTLTFKGIWPGGSRDVSPTCGLTLDGTAYCWGSNSRGQLGTSETLPSGVCITGQCTGSPVRVATTSKFVTLRPGGEHVCGITTDHVVLCWGSNAKGQLGDGNGSDSSTPVSLGGTVRVP